MLNTLNRFWHVSVHDQYDGTVECRTHYLDLWYEVMTRVSINPMTYEVKDVVLEVMRWPHGKEKTFTRHLDSLRGLIAFRDAAGKVAEATKEDDTGLWTSMILEAPKAFNQAINFVWKRNGIDPRPYLPVLEKFFRNSCIYFVDADISEGLFNPPAYHEQTRGDILFSRYRYCFLEGQNGKRRVTAGLSDSSHEMVLDMELENNLVLAGNAKILRAPYEICYKAVMKAESLQGKLLSSAVNGWGKELQGREGCTHLADLARECESSLLFWQKLNGQGEKNSSSRCVGAEQK